MKRILLAFAGLAFCATFVQAKEPSKQTNFTGEWVLDFSQTKNSPPGLEDYSMVVKQDRQQLKVETSLKGDLQARSDQNGPSSGGGYPGSSTGGYPGGGRRGGMGGIGGGMGWPGGSVGMPGGGMGMPGGGRGGRGGGGGTPRNEGASRGTIAAYKLYPQSAAYNLDGSESTVQLGDPDASDASSKSEWAKNGEQLKLSLTSSGDSGQKNGKIQIKDQWKLSDDGQYLMVDRSVHSPGGSGSVHLVFLKRAAAGSTSGSSQQ